MVLAQEEIKDTILSGIFDSIALNDIAYRSGIRDTFVLKDIISYLADNVGQLVNPSTIANVLKNEIIVTGRYFEEKKHSRNTYNLHCRLAVE